MYLKDRTDAGRRLFPLLEKYRNRDAVVYALPRGGVVLAAEIAAHLNIPLDLVIARKVGHPLSPEYAIAAVTEHGDIACNEQEAAVLGQSWFTRQVEIEKREAQRRRDTYMSGRTQYTATGKIAILVDDGIATGLTMKAAIADIKRQKPEKIVVAIPIVPSKTARELMKLVDDLAALEVSAYYLGAVGAYYADFPQIADREVILMLDRVNPRKLVAQHS